MKADSKTIKTNTHLKWIGTGMLAAIASSLCCITPVLALLSGVSGIAATFSWLGPVRPLLIAITIVILSFAWYQKLKPRTAEEIECACEEDKKQSFWQSKKYLGLATIFAAFMLAFPLYSDVFFPENNSTKTVLEKENSLVEASLIIKGMTCSGCEHSVNHALISQEGVIETSSSYKSGVATVKFDQTKLSIEELAALVKEATGYDVTTADADLN